MEDGVHAVIVPLLIYTGVDALPTVEEQALREPLLT